LVRDQSGGRCGGGRVVEVTMISIFKEGSSLVVGKIGCECLESVLVLVSAIHGLLYETVVVVLEPLAPLDPIAAPR
jgi:hypothetical protein